MPLMLIEIGTKKQLSRQIARNNARALAQTMSLLSPTDVVDLSIGGFDDDPREIWEIPEARDFFVTFADTLLAARVDMERLLLQAREVIACCRAAQAGRPVVVTGTREDTVREGVEQFIMQMRAGERKVN
jgi:hypothetical protein